MANSSNGYLSIKSDNADFIDSVQEVMLMGLVRDCR